MGEIIKAGNVIIKGEREITNSTTKLEKPQIRVNKKDGIVKSIDITCSSGEQIHIICEYESKSIPAYPDKSGSSIQLNAPTSSKEKPIVEEAPQ